ncbi:MAG: hypothetical protein HY275_13520 [Gemmatimonadetes bacterium]|nr:hypothetical protein [Gemmatimonadota bacterium]
MALVALAGCAIGATLRSYDVAPNGLERSEERLRLGLLRARADTAVLPRKDDLSGDALLRKLYEGTYAYYNGRFRDAGAAFDEADALTEARFTKSISQNALAMLTNDRELDYEPGINERLLMHYYGALAFWRAGDPEGATVEARKLAYLLQKYEADTLARDRTLRHALRTFAGLVFEAAGERNDALVSYRNAAAILGARVNTDTAESLPSDALTADSGDVIVVVEQGFVAFPLPWDLTVPIYRHEWEYVAGADRFRGGWMSARMGNRITAQLGGDGGLWYVGPSYVLAPGDQWAGLTAGTAGDVSLTYRAGAQYGYRYDPRWGWRPARVLSTPERIIKLSVPVYKRPRAMPAPTLLGASATVIAAADLSEAEVADFDRVRTWTYARAVLRVAVKAAAAEAAERAAENAARDKKKKEDKNAERLGWLAGFLTSAAGAVLERADTRNWNLLPQAVTILRVRAPVGTRDLRISAPGEPGGELVIPAVTVKSGRISIATARAWSSPAEW